MTKAIGVQKSTCGDVQVRIRMADGRPYTLQNDGRQIWFDLR
ncbi:hypothetical protein [Paractinoplanes ovalisporus]|nr:hypothetical protein [Actinoplanes ovalisporus]